MTLRAPPPSGPPDCTHDPPCWEWVEQIRGMWVWTEKPLHQWDGKRWTNRRTKADDPV